MTTSVPPSHQPRFKRSVTTITELLTTVLGSAEAFPSSQKVPSLAVVSLLAEVFAREAAPRGKCVWTQSLILLPQQSLHASLREAQGLCPFLTRAGGPWRNRREWYLLPKQMSWQSVSLWDSWHRENALNPAEPGPPLLLAPDATKC